jgi:hypothetical protein
MKTASFSEQYFRCYSKTRAKAIKLTELCALEQELVACLAGGMLRSAAGTMGVTAASGAKEKFLSTLGSVMI